MKYYEFTSLILTDERCMEFPFMDTHDTELNLIPPLFSRIDVPLKYK